MQSLIIYKWIIIVLLLVALLNIKKSITSANQEYTILHIFTDENLKEY